MAKPTSDTQILTANRLTDGIVVFWTTAREWSEQIDEADIASDPEWNGYLRKVGEVAEARNIIVEPYLVAVSQNEGAIEPLHIREKFRTLGPSVRPDLGKQSRIAANSAAELTTNEPALIAAE